MALPGLEECTAQDLADTIDPLHSVMCAVQGQLLAVIGEYERREAWREACRPGNAG